MVQHTWRNKVRLWKRGRGEKKTLYSKKGSRKVKECFCGRIASTMPRDSAQTDYRGIMSDRFGGSLAPNKKGKKGSSKLIVRERTGSN